MKIRKEFTLEQLTAESVNVITVSIATVDNERREIGRSRMAFVNSPTGRKQLTENLDLSDEKHLNLIQGMLALTSHKILVRKEVFNLLCENCPDLNGLPCAQEEYLVFNENVILNHHSNMDYKKKKEQYPLAAQKQRIAHTERDS